MKNDPVNECLIVFVNGQFLKSFNTTFRKNTKVVKKKSITLKFFLTSINFSP